MPSINTIASLLFLLLLCLVTYFFPVEANLVVTYLKELLLNNFGYLYQWLSGAILLIALVVSLTRRGGKVLGNPEKRIQNLPYYSLIFSTGMGVSMIYWGVLEPLAHVDYGMNKISAMSSTYFNWGANAWSFYFIVTIFILTFAFREKKLYENRFVSLVLILTTVVGLSLSIIYSIDAIGQAPNIPFINSSWLPYIVTIGLSLVAFISVKSGITRWMSRFSMINMAIAMGLMFWVFINIPSKEALFGTMAEATGQYIAQLPKLTFLKTQADEWMVNWPYTYYAAWIGWSLFVGGFIAIISQGRTFRNIAFSILIIPTIFSIFWFTIFGEAAIQANVQNIFDLLDSSVLFTFFKYLTLISIMLFFVTSEDSGSMILYTLDPRISRGGWLSIMAFLAMIIFNLGGDSVGITRTLVALFSFPLLIIVGYMTYKVFRFYCSSDRQQEEAKIAVDIVDEIGVKPVKEAKSY